MLEQGEDCVEGQFGEPSLNPGGCGLEGAGCRAGCCVAA